MLVGHDRGPAQAGALRRVLGHIDLEQDLLVGGLAKTIGHALQKRRAQDRLYRDRLARHRGDVGHVKARALDELGVLKPAVHHNVLVNLELPQLRAGVAANPLKLTVLARAILVVGARLEASRLQERVDARVVLGAVQVDARERLRRRGQRLVVLGVGGKPACGVGRGLNARVAGVLVGRPFARNLDVRREVLLAGAHKDVGLAAGHGRDNPVLVDAGHRVIRRHVRHLAQDARDAQLGRLARVKRELRGRQHGRLLREDRQVVLVGVVDNRLVARRGVNRMHAREAIGAAAAGDRAAKALIFDCGHAVGNAQRVVAADLTGGVAANSGHALGDGNNAVVDSGGKGQDKSGAAVGQDLAVLHRERAALDQADVVQAVGKRKGRGIKAGQARGQLNALELARSLERGRADRLQSLVQSDAFQRAAVREGLLTDALDAGRNVDRVDVRVVEALVGNLRKVSREGHLLSPAVVEGALPHLGHRVAKHDLLDTV